MDYASPTTLDEALESLASGAVPLAGGTDFYPARLGEALEERIVDLTGLSELRGIDSTRDGLRIGALTTWAEIARLDLPAGCGALQRAAREVGGLQVQNVATIGGNLCNASPAADGVPPLLTVDASVELVSTARTRTVPVEEFLIGYRHTAIRPDEVLTAVLIPHRATEGRSAFLKLGSRRYLVISVVMVAARLVVGDAGTITEARVAVGACSPTARRLEALEADLVGVGASEASDLVEERHFEPLSPIDDGRATADYRREAARVMVRRALDECAAP